MIDILVISFVKVQTVRPQTEAGEGRKTHKKGCFSARSAEKHPFLCDKLKSVRPKTNFGRGTGG
jgi:hypothetical protein